MGNLDGAGATSTFNHPFGIVIDQTSVYLYVSCMDANTLRRVEVVTGPTITIAGSGVAGSNDGQGITAKFNGPAYNYECYFLCYFYS